MIKNDTAAKFCLTAVFFVYAGFICFFKIVCNKLFIKNPIIRINTVFFKEIAIKNRSFYHEFTTFERALI